LLLQGLCGDLRIRFLCRQQRKKKRKRENTHALYILGISVLSEALSLWKPADSNSFRSPTKESQKAKSRMKCLGREYYISTPYLTPYISVFVYIIFCRCTLGDILWRNWYFSKGYIYTLFDTLYVCICIYDNLSLHSRRHPMEKYQFLHRVISTPLCDILHVCICIYDNLSLHSRRHPMEKLVFLHGDIFTPYMTPKKQIFPTFGDMHA